MNKNFVIGLLGGGILWLLYKNKKKKGCTCQDADQAIEEESGGGGAMGSSSSKKSYKKASEKTDMPSAKSVLDKYSKEDICACKDAVKTVASQMKFASAEDKKSFLDQEIIKCLETE